MWAIISCDAIVKRLPVTDFPEQPDHPGDDFAEDETPWRPGQDELVQPTDASVPDQPHRGAADAVATDTTVDPAPASDAPQEPDASPASEREPTSDTPGNSAPPGAPEITTAAVVEAVLFAADEPVTPQKLVAIIGTGNVKEVRKHITALNKKYEEMDCSFRIEPIAGGYQMLTLPQFNVWLRQLLKVRSESKLSPAALETLAIIAYKQPIMRVDVESIRGVAAGEMIRQLIDKGLVKIVGRAQVIGRPLLYGTTKRFLAVFGLNSLKDLPTAQDLKQPD